MVKSSRRTAAKITAIDLFCGVGGFSLGMEKAGISVVAAFDRDRRNTSMYALNFPDAKAFSVDLGAITAGEILKAANTQEIDLVFGGPPCQGFSQIGKRETNDPRNSLLRRFCEIVVALRPKYFVFENVEGLLRGAARSVLADSLRLLRKGGYKFVAPIRVLDACQFGVPQYRRRVFVIGSLKELKTPQYPSASRGRKPTVWDAIADLVDSAPTGLTGLARTKHSDKTIRRFENTKPGEIERVSRFYRLTKNGFCNTLRAGTDESRGSYTAARPIHPVEPRCITVREAARLHSYPDSFRLHETVWHGFRQVGNSVPPKLARAVATALIKQAYIADHSSASVNKGKYR